MKYRLNKQGYGSLMDGNKVLVLKDLTIEIDAEGETVKLVSAAENSPYYETVKDGKCVFPRSALVGDIGISVITKQGTIPCTALVAVETQLGTVVLPDAREILSRLERVERDISNTLVVHEELTGKYKDLEDKLSRLFDGYNF